MKKEDCQPWSNIPVERLISIDKLRESVEESEIETKLNLKSLESLTIIEHDEFPIFSLDIFFEEHNLNDNLKKESKIKILIK
jgi:hypothetical protein